MNALGDLIARHWRSAVEIAILAAILYHGYLYFRGTRGAKVMTGLALSFLTINFLAQLLGLDVIGWLLRSFFAILAVAMVVIFQPELRRAMAELGSRHLLPTLRDGTDRLEPILDAVAELSRTHVGALIAIERETSLRHHAETGVRLDAMLTKELILSIFHVRAPLHDGGVIVHDDRVVAAACVFPLSQSENLDRTLGLRHRAGIGIAEESDAVAIVVSEETGAISVCRRDKIERNLHPDELPQRLRTLLLMDQGAPTPDPQLAGETRRDPARRDDLDRDP